MGHYGFQYIQDIYIYYNGYWDILGYINGNYENMDNWDIDWEILGY